MSNKIKKRCKKSKNNNKIIANVTYVFQIKVVDFTQNFNFKYARIIITYSNYINKEENNVASLEIEIALNVVYISATIYNILISTKNN